jgi:hypothetical protein
MRIADVNEHDISELEMSRYASATLYNDAYAEKLLNLYLETKNQTLPDSKQDLDKMLQLFFASIRTKEGEHFSTGGITNVYQAVCRLFSRKHKVDLRGDPIFSKSRDIVKNMKAVAKKQGKGFIKYSDNW